ncbi:Aconitase A/isopropylmalate dehydratase small subunit, swivel domain [Dillenia turbinata]|uniref:3-isopropylmalate dehydratase n=1 Tax=Dillenia turbinata TaxID=194707 RepID=A0AAN8VSS5_9MAGN
MAAISFTPSTSPSPSQSSPKPNLFSSCKLSFSLLNNATATATHLTKCFFKPKSYPSKPLTLCCASTAPSSPSPSTTTKTTFHGVCYVVGDNIDTDQIIPAEHLTLVPSKPDEYQKLGSFALCGLPAAKYPIPFVEPNEFKTKFSILIAGDNFGCGSSREHAPVALGAAGVTAVVAESYARIFFRNSVATGEVYPLESEIRVCEECKTGDVVTIELGDGRLINHSTGKEYKLKAVGDVGPVIEAGGIFAYARKMGMIPTQSA